MYKKRFLRELGKMLKYHRLSKDMTLKVLARRINMCRATLSQVENGKVSPSLQTLLKIKRVLKFNITIGEVTL